MNNNKKSGSVLATIAIALLTAAIEVGKEALKRLA
jgi:hypothetical protein